MAELGKHATKTYQYRDFMNEIGTAGNADFTWRDESAGVRDRDTEFCRGQTEGGPDAIPVHTTTDDLRAIRLTATSGTSFTMHSRNTGSNRWFEDYATTGKLDITMESGTATITGSGLILTDLSATFTAGMQGKKVFFPSTQNLFATVVSVDSATQITLDIDRSAENGNTYYIIEPTHVSFWYYVHEYAHGDDVGKLTTITWYLSNDTANGLNDPNVRPNFLNQAAAPGAADNLDNWSPRTPGWHHCIKPIGTSTFRVNFDPTDIVTASFRFHYTTPTTSIVITPAELSLWSVSDSPRIAFTADDGTYSTDGGSTEGGNMRISRILDDYGVKGTFYVIGGRVHTTSGQRYDGGDFGGSTDDVYCNLEDLQDMQSRGHLIASHTWDHLAMWDNSTGDVTATQTGTNFPNIYLESVRRNHEFLKENGFEGYDLLATPFGQMRGDIQDRIMREGLARQIATVTAMGSANPEYVGLTETAVTNDTVFWPLYVDPIAPWRLNWALASYTDDYLLSQVILYNSTCVVYTHSINPGGADGLGLKALCAAHQAGTIEMIRMDEMLPSAVTASGGGDISVVGAAYNSPYH